MRKKVKKTKPSTRQHSARLTSVRDVDGTGREDGLHGELFGILERVAGQGAGA